MTQQLKVICFQLQGRCEAINTADEVRANAEKQHIMRLNRSAEEMADDIERRLRKHLPPHVGVQVDVHFDRGSVVLAGTVALLLWGGSAALDVVTEEAKQALATIIGGVTQRVITAALANDPPAASPLSPMQVTAIPVASGEWLLPSQTTAESRASSPAAPAGWPSAAMRSSNLVPALTFVTFFVLLVQIMLVFDRFYMLTPRP